MKTLVKNLFPALFVIPLFFNLAGTAWAQGRGEGADCTPGANQCMTGLYCDKDTSKCEPVLGRVSQPYGPGGYGSEGFGLFLSNVVSAILVVAGILLFFYLVFGGFKYMTAGGDEKAVTAAKNMLTNAGIGMAIVVAAWFIAKVLEVVLGIKILSTEFVGP